MYMTETVDDELKSIAIEYSKCYSFNCFITSIFSTIATYCLLKKRPAIDVKFINDRRLILF